MISYLKALYTREGFRPSLLSIFINPFFFLRRGLYKAVKSNADFMHGIMLDFGCGSKPYQKLFKVQQYIGIDIEDIGHDHTNEHIDVFYDGKRIPFDDNYFDAVFSSEVFEHIFNLNEILDELHRVMKPGAHLLITLPFVWNEHEIPHDFARYTSFAIRHLLENKGFKIIKSEKTGNFVEAVFQMWNVYIKQSLLPANRYLKVLLTPLAISPVTILGLILSKILPINNNLYHNNIVVAQNSE